jgi:hypothetical protein
MLMRHKDGTVKCIGCGISSLDSSGFIIGVFNNKYNCENCADID